MLFVLSISQAMSHGFDELEFAVNSGTVKLAGTLTIPAHAHMPMPVMIIVAGSGPTDRNCNGPSFSTDAYKKMAHQLAMQGIASYRYDKRGIGASEPKNLKEEEMRFDDLVHDLKNIIATFEKDDRFTSVVVCGHSEGSLVAMLAVEAKQKYISIAGASQPADVILKDQLKGQLGELEASTFKKLDSLKVGKHITCDNPMLLSLLRPSVQPYMISWFRHDPTAIIKNVSSPTLIINGTKDLQVPIAHGERLSKATKNARYVAVPNMTHTLTEVASDELQDNYASYTNPNLPLSATMMNAIVSFVRTP